MKAVITLASGGCAVLLGVIGIWTWMDSFLKIIAAVLPVMLVIGGGLAMYLGIDEIKARKAGDDDY